MTGTNCDLFTHNQSRSYLNHLVQPHFPSQNLAGGSASYVSQHNLLYLLHRGRHLIVNRLYVYSVVLILALTFIFLQGLCVPIH